MPRAGFPGVTYPEPVTFATFGHPKSYNAAVKVLEEAAELVEAVKDYENLPGCPECPDNEPLWRGQARFRVLEEAMDVYQAVSNFLGCKPSDEVGTIYGDTSEDRMTKDGAIDVLVGAGVLVTELDLDYGRYTRENAESVIERMSKVIYGEFTDEDIAEAYKRCVNKNRMRGRL